MKLSEIEIGTKLEMELFNDDGTRFETILASEMEWSVDAYEAIIAAPIFEGNVFPIQIGTMMYLFFLNSNEAAKNYYKFSAVVKGRELAENLHLLRVELQSEIEKVQRRKYFRLDCSVQVKYRQVYSFLAADNADIPYKKMIANNISGGGISLMMEDMIDADSFVECEIFTDQNRKVRFFGQVVRCEKSDRKGKFKYEAAIVFININENDREVIVQYIFSEQRRLRKKGLI